MSREIHFECNSVISIQEVFPLLSNPTYQTDFVCINVEELYTQTGSNVFDLVNTLSTLINCTVSRGGPGRPKKRTTKIIGLVKLSSASPQIVKEILTMSAFCGICIIPEHADEYNDSKQSLVNCINGVSEVPKKIQEFLKQKKSIIDNSPKDGMSLTARQSQVLDLIATRGASNKTIARMLNISESTVKLHVTSVFKKYGVKNRTQLAVFAVPKKKSSELNL